ncbi:MAG TPA: methyltransferase domain-containing protein [Acidimicrobiales bacterium]|nr:methyltransferase domain-containing protein [Acidimicrobiales bacterium]
MSPDASGSGYPEWTFSGEAANHHYLVPAVLRSLPDEQGLRLLDIGCGNGALSARLAQAGMKVTGIDFTLSGIDRARGSFPDLEFAAHDITEPLPSALRGQFQVVVSAEVIEHLFLPRVLFARATEALVPGGTLIVTTPYHGYWKNLAIALTGRFDGHWVVGSDYGHIKFFSRRTLEAMARECGFEPVRLIRAGRIPPLAATMVMTARLRTG